MRFILHWSAGDYDTYTNYVYPLDTGENVLSAEEVALGLYGKFIEKFKVREQFWDEIQAGPGAHLPNGRWDEEQYKKHYAHVLKVNSRYLVHPDIADVEFYNLKVSLSQLHDEGVYVNPFIQTVDEFFEGNEGYALPPEKMNESKLP